MINGNRTLLNLDIKYISLGSQNCEKLVNAIKNHQQLMILDISGNEISQEGFQHVLQLLKKQSQLRTLKARDNSIQGKDLQNQLSEKSLNSSNIESIDLSDNDIDNSFSLMLMKMVNQNYIIEKLSLKGNKKVNYTNIEHIEQECRKNYLIKRYIGPRFIMDTDQ